MPNEIYHRSEWGNPKAEGFGDVYFDASATNKLYKHSDYYENSDGTDKILRDIPNKASIVLTPTAYSDGSLNTVIPPYQVSSELVTNGNFDTDSDWNKDDSWSISGGKANYDYISGRNLNSSTTTLIVGKTYQIEYTISNYISGSVENSSAETQISNNSNGTYTEVFTARYTFLRFRGSTNGEFSIDNVSVKEVQEADFDFSRGSSATRVNEKGLIEDVQILSSNLVQNGDFEEIGSELVTNGNFDTDSDWSTEGTSSFSIANGVLNCFSDGAYAGVSQNIVLEQGKTYKLELDIVRIGENSGSLNFGDQTSYILLSFVSSSDDLGKKTIYFKPERTTTIIRIYRSSACDIDLDNLSVKEVGQNWTFGTGWSIEDGKAVSDGSQTGTSFLYQLYSFTSGKKYRITYDIEVISGSIFSRLAGGGSTVDGNTQTASGTYTDDLVASVNHTNISFGASNDFVGSIDNISVIEITDDTDIPRIDYTSGQGALLLEPSRTNLETKSNEFSTWSLNSNITRTADYIISPDGTLNGTRMQFTANGYVGNTTQVNTTQYTISCYAKRNDSGAQNVGFFINGSGVVNSVWEITSEWKRFTYTYTSSNTSFVGIAGISGADISVYGFQIEQAGSYPTSYIPTNGSTVTRSADVANNSGNADLINSTEGVLYCEAATLVDPTSVMIIGLSDGTTANRVSITFHSTLNRIQIFAQKNSVQLFNIDNTSVSKTNFNKIAISYSSTSAKFFLNGTLVASATPSDMFVSNTLDRVNFDIGSGSNDFYGNVKSLAVFKEALTDAELESLTSWVSFTEMATDLEYTLE